ncbi:unnamed protein product [Rotaria sordida]|uniref:Septin-type G domain-containing protein n=1 Tax=Rotaria sordida TaxID=392033 RepID=A0A818TSI8_9BILA|nr:unnamed protein product [Rotaria sordida]
MNETSRSQSSLNLFKTQDGYPIERKVIEPSGRLGSLYDASTDNLIDRHSAQRIESKIPRKRFTCRLLSRDQSTDVISFLKDIDFDDAIRQSICLQMITPRGISRLIEYNQVVDENTRFLYYCYRARKEWLDVTAHQTHKIVAAPLNPTEATHMITKILWGFEVLCVIQIPKHESVNSVDQLLHHICDQLQNNRIPIKLNSNDRQLINQLNNIAVYGSETCINQANTSLLTILTRIQDWQKDSNVHQPLIYTMQPLRWLYNGPQFNVPCSFPRPDNPHIARIEIVIKRINNQIKDLEEIFRNLPTNFSSTILDQRLKNLQQKYRFVLNSQDNFQKHLRQALKDIRRHCIEPPTLDDIIGDQRYECLRNSELDKFLTNIQQLLNKSILIEKLKNNHIEYFNVFDIHSNQEIPTTIDNIDAILKRTYSNKNDSVILWYSSDRLKREKEDLYQQIYQELTWEQQQHVEQRIKLIYVDFSYFKDKLEDFIIVRLPLAETLTTERDSKKDTVHLLPPSKQRARSSSPLSKQSSRSSPTLPKPPPVPPREPLSISKPIEINVLLLGEIGVGKSTFINAFINYLKFENLQQAEQDEPVVLIPVSSLITVGDRSDEFAVKLGNADSNENHEQQGQSVTQQCKSYVFDLNNRLRLRFIDTPGIGDNTRDIKTIDHILTYINNLSHLNGICLLLKSNTAQLNVFYHLCLNQLLTYLTPTAYNNIIFCFTNTRSTLYAPGDTGLLLRKMLDDEHLNNIPFKQENTFCFDSESFRYLVARKCGINFDEYQKQEYISSWYTSVTESVRLLKFIRKCKSYYLEDWLSPRKAIFDILMLVRPLLETLRLIIYNWQLSEAKIIINHMVLNSNPIDIEMCTNCAQIKVVEGGPFWLTQYQSAILDNNTNQHSCCPINGKHFLIEFNVTHEFVPLPAGLKNERWQSSFHNFLFKCDRLLHFLRQQESTIQDDPFQYILERYLEEEEQISQIPNINSNMNKLIHDVLKSIKQIREENRRKLLESNERLSLNLVYQIIDELIAIPTVRKQIDSIKRSRQLKMKQHERTIPKNLIRNKIFA